MLFAATVCNAQVVLWDGTDKEVGSDGGFWNRADPTVVEEDGNKIMKFTLKANPGGWNDEHHNAALPVGDVDFKALRRLTMRLKMTDAHNVLVQLEGKDGAYNAERIAWYDGGDGWQVMVYEFAAGPDNEKVTDNGNNVLAIWPFEKTAAGEGKTFYVDDIKAYRFQTRSADTNVRLRDGETMVIGGLIGSEEAQRLSKIPFLGDLPILGHFFRHTSKSRTESELLIFLKARILDDKDMIVSDTERIEEEANGNKNTDSR